MLARDIGTGKKESGKLQRGEAREFIMELPAPAKPIQRQVQRQEDDSASVLGASTRNRRLFARAEKRWREQATERLHQREAQVVLERIHKHGVFFYPGSGTDWSPLRGFTDLCDTFVFCDWLMEPDPVIRSLTNAIRLLRLEIDFLVSLDFCSVTLVSLFGQSGWQ